jgi:hypothetical protein
VDRGHHPAIEQVAGLMDARRVDENDLRVVEVTIPFIAVARRLRLVGNGGDLLADKAFDQRRFSGVGPPMSAA